MKGLKSLWCVVVGLVVGLAGSVVKAEPPAFELPEIVDWTSVVGAIVTYVGAAFLVIYGAILAFAFVKKLLRRLRGVA